MNFKSVYVGEKDLTHLYSINLKNYVDLEINYCDSIDKLKLDNMDLIIIENSMRHKALAEEAIEFLNNNNSEIPVLFIGPKIPNYEKSDSVINRLDLKSIIKTCAKILGITSQIMASHQVEEYTFFDLPSIYLLENAQIKIYNKNEDTYEQINLNEARFKETINQLRINGVRGLYVHSTDRLKAVKVVTRTILSRLQETTLTIAEKMEFNGHSLEVYKKLMIELGMGEETFDLASATTHAMVILANQNNTLNKLLENLKKIDHSYMYANAQLTMYLSFQCLSYMSWKNKDHFKKLAFASFFHDITLNDVTCKLVDDADALNLQIPREEKKQILHHAHEIAEFVTKIPEAPIGIDQIIKQHHGQLNGIGFTHSWSEQIAPLSMIFIVCEELSRRILDCKKAELNYIEIFEETKAYFKSPKYIKFIDAIQDHIPETCKKAA